MKKHGKSHSGFTLVELLVVFALMAILATLTIAFFPSAANQNREAKAGTLVQGWLNIAKQRALQDQAPRGLRLLIGSTLIGGTTLNNVVTECQYIEQPTDYWAGPTSSIQSVAAGAPDLPAPLPGQGFTPANTLKLMYPAVPNPDLLNGYLTTDPPALWTVQPWLVKNAGVWQQPTPTEWGPGQVNQWQWLPGDSLELCGTGLIYKITHVGVNQQSNFFSIDPPLPAVNPLLPAGLNTPTTNYRIIRSPRAVGETLELPAGTLIDLATNSAAPAGFNNPLPLSAGYVDILFSPSGAVISRGVTQANLNLWVRAPGEGGVPGSQNDPINVFAGRPTIVTVFVNTGFVGAYAVGPAATPYSLVGL